MVCAKDFKPLLKGCSTVAFFLMVPGCSDDRNNLFVATSDGLPDDSHRIFVTSQPTASADFRTNGGAADGLSGGDNVCQTAAAAAGLVRTYKAILSSNTVNAKDRLTIPNSVYNLSAPTTPLLVTSVGSGLWNANVVNLTNPVVYAEDYTQPTGLAWTGTTVTGTSAFTCVNWTDSSNGFVARYADLSGIVTGQWLGQFNTTCDDNTAHLYCISQP